jgi:putative transposase
MPRVARVVASGLPHHITQRGNNRQDVFFAAEDRLAYLWLLLEESKKHGLALHGFCLMTNHVHLIATPRRTESLAGALGRTHFRYTQYINRHHGRSGHLWQNRFFSCPLDEPHLLATMRYVERNPVRAKMVRAPWRYPWSSAAAHCGEPDATGLLDLKWWTNFAPPARWKAMLKAGEDDAAQTMLIRTQTRTGRPLGSDRFIAKLESRLGRRLRRPAMGRPKRPDEKDQAKGGGTRRQK